MPFKIATYHVGLPKTGSTAIQDFLLARRTNLAALGIFYPHMVEIIGADYDAMPGADRERSWTGHMMLSTELLANRGRLETAAQKLFARKTLTRRVVFAAEAAGCERLMISSEGFATRVAKGARTLPLELRGERTDVVAFFRRKDDWILSRYKQHLKDPRRLTLTAREFIESLRPIANDYLAICHGLVRFFGVERPAILDYDRERADIFGALRTAANLPDFPPIDDEPVLPPPESALSNLSLSNLASLFLLQCNLSPMSEADRVAVRDALFAIDAEMVAAFGEIDLMPLDLRMWAVASHDADIFEINHRFGSDLQPALAGGSKTRGEFREALTARETARFVEALAAKLPAETHAALTEALAASAR